MAHVGAATALQDVAKPNEVAVDVGRRVGDGVAHAGLGSQVDDSVNAMLLE